MRTKTLLIAAAAALAAGIISSQAQVYSQNIVGYVNTVLPNGNTAIINPMINADGTNGAENVLTCLQGGDGLLVWNGAGYNGYTFISAGSWVDGNGNPTVEPKLGPGVGFFYQNGQGINETNTFVGTVSLTNMTTLPNGNTLIGSGVPIAGAADSTNINLPLQGGDGLLVWNGAGYNGYTFISVGSWVDGNGNPTTSPVLNVGTSFFYQNGQGVNETWTNSITVQ